METRDGVADFIGNVDECRFKVTEGHAAVVGRFGSNALAGFRIGDKHRDAPVCRPVEVVGEAVVGFEEAEHLAVDVVLAAGGEFAAQMRCHTLNVVLKQVDIGENAVVDALQHIVCTLWHLGFNQESVVDEALS